MLTSGCMWAWEGGIVSFHRELQNERRVLPLPSGNLCFWIRSPSWLLIPQDHPSLLYPVTLGTIQTQFSVASWLQVKLCQLGGLQGWRREQGLAPSSVLLVPVSITLAMTLHLAVTVPSKSNAFQFLFFFFFPIVSELASEILGSRPTLDLGPALQSPSSKLLSD